MASFFWDNLFKADRKETTVYSAIKSNILFRDLTVPQLRLVQNIVNVRSYQKQEQVFRFGEAGVGMYIIVSGSVDITLDERLITQLKEGDFFGEIALVEENGRRTATATATEETTLIGFFKPDLMEIASRSPSTGVKILLRLAQVLGTRLLETTATIRTLKRDARAHDQKNS